MTYLELDWQGKHNQKKDVYEFLLLWLYLFVCLFFLKVRKYYFGQFGMTVLFKQKKKEKISEICTHCAKPLMRIVYTLPVLYQFCEILGSWPWNINSPSSHLDIRIPTEITSKSSFPQIFNSSLTGCPGWSLL